MKRSKRFLLAGAATVLAAAALVFYLISGTVMTYVAAMVIAAVVLGIVNVIFYLKIGEKEITSLLISAEAVLIIGACAYSLITEVEVLGYLVSGLRQWSDVQFWAFFSVAAILSWILLLIASFIQPKECLGAE